MRELNIEKENGEWRTENRMENGEWRMKNVEWGMENGEWRILKIRNLSKRESLKRGIFKSENL